jgi:hypothetical protein
MFKSIRVSFTGPYSPGVSSADNSNGTCALGG